MGDGEVLRQARHLRATRGCCGPVRDSSGVALEGQQACTLGVNFDLSGRSSPGGLENKA